MDLLLAYCFMHPMVSLLARRPEARAAPGRRHRGGARRAGRRHDDHDAHRPRRPSDDIPGVTRRHRPSDFYHERTNFQFIKHSRRWAILSGTLILSELRARCSLRGLNFGIDFEGGTSWQVQMAHGQHRARDRGARSPRRRSGSATRRSPRCRATTAQSVNVQEHVVTDPINTITNDARDLRRR